MRFALLLVGLVALGCGESSSGGGGGAPGAGGTSGQGGSAGAVAGQGGTAGDAGSAGAGGGGASGASGAKSSGDCNSDGGCPGGKCIELLPDGFRVCQYPVDEATSCGTAGNDECCASAECTGGAKCYPGPTALSCGGAPPPEYNVCASDECTPGEKCGQDPPSVCMPAGFEGFKVAACRAGGCFMDGDCTAEPGGICAPVHEPCCDSVIGMYCIYPGDGCRGQHDCPDGTVCTVELAAARCVQGPLACPP
jgi:hypothetical protein